MLKRVFLHWVISMIAVGIAVWLAKSIGMELSWPHIWNIAIFVPVLALANAIVGPILRLFSMPITCATFGLFSFVINALLFWLAGSLTGAKMNFLSALFGSVIVALVGSILNLAIKRNN